VALSFAASFSCAARKAIEVLISTDLDFVPSCPRLSLVYKT
jgi:hypothetical protein